LRLCLLPGEPVFIANVRTTQGSGFATLDVMDPNQPARVTGYNVYRSSDPAADPALWPRLAQDAADMDEATPDSGHALQQRLRRGRPVLRSGPDPDQCYL
jgi:hypothetical protein